MAGIFQFVRLTFFKKNSTLYAYLEQLVIQNKGDLWEETKQVGKTCLEETYILKYHFLDSRAVIHK
jgi:hypothetical protein